MKKMTKKMIALFMTLLTVAAMLPITASAAQYARIVVELNEPYYGENLAEILPEIEIEAAYPFIEGYAFTVYYDHASDEDAYEAAEKLKANPLVKSAVYCPYEEENVTRAKFSFALNSYEKVGGNVRFADLAELFPTLNIVKAESFVNNRSYRIYFDVSSREEVCKIFDEILSSPFVSSAFYWHEDQNEVSVGRVKVTLRGKRSEDEVKDLFSEMNIEAVDFCNDFTYYLHLEEKTLEATLEAVDMLKNNDNVVAISYSMGFLHPAVMPKQLEEYYYNKDVRAEVTVETALQALRIASGITDLNFELLNDRLREAFWLYDVDIDGRITVADALSLLRTAAGLAA